MTLLFFKLILEREERRNIICSSTYPCTDWSLLIRALAEGKLEEPSTFPQRSETNLLSYPARVLNDFLQAIGASAA